MQDKQIQQGFTELGKFAMKWDEPKSEILHSRVTPTAKSWYMANGSTDLLERLARGLVNIVDGEVREKP